MYFINHIIVPVRTKKYSTLFINNVDLFINFTQYCLTVRFAIAVFFTNLCHFNSKSTKLRRKAIFRAKKKKILKELYIISFDSEARS